MPTYDAVRFSPPAPVALIELRDTTSGRPCADVPMLLDTGADVTLVLQKCVNQLQVTVDPSRSYELMGFDGSRSKAMSVQLDLIFAGRTFRGRFLIVDQPEGVLGRNILNYLDLTFDGPKLLWETIS